MIIDFPEKIRVIQITRNNDSSHILKMRSDGVNNLGCDWKFPYLGTNELLSILLIRSPRCRSFGMGFGIERGVPGRNIPKLSQRLSSGVNPAVRTLHTDMSRLEVSYRSNRSLSGDSIDDKRAKRRNIVLI
ncbi:MAG: hypothetical protein FOGNACKC_00720 [Anaerolineae bacterium]|nr:hypothetical protein [Anaerolineae bacterium]